MKQFTKKLAAVVAAGIMAMPLSACGEAELTEEEQAAQEEEQRLTSEMKQNDYRGGITRTNALKDLVVNVMEGMKANNDIIRQDSPNSFWTADGYQDFVSTFLDISIIEDTKWFNEEEGTWETTMKMLTSEKNAFTKSADGGYTLNCEITRNEKDDYSATGVPWSMNVMLSDVLYSYSGKANYHILYDCDKDWCKAYSTMETIKNVDPTMVELFEYRRIDDNTFAIQTSRERVYIVLEPTETDTDIRGRTVKEFYYSKLVSGGQRTTFEAYAPLPETDQNNAKLTDNIKLNELMAENPAFNNKGECCSRYGDDESLFYLSDENLTREWVFEDKSLQQAICYKDGILMATTYNKLSDSYERFIYAKSGADTNISKELEELVEIKSLVGVVEVDIVATVGASDALKTVTDEKEAQTEITEATEVTKVTEVTEATAADENLTSTTQIEEASSSDVDIHTDNPDEE